MSKRGNRTQRGQGRGWRNTPISVADEEPFLCACGCYASGWRKIGSGQQYVNGTHRKRRYDADKRHALYTLIYDILRVYTSIETAARKALECVEKSVKAWYRALNLWGLTYDSKAKGWARAFK